MTVTEIKNLTKYLTDEEVEDIKKEIKSKETILKSGNLDEEELGQVLNTLFAILVIEKTLEQQVEEIEDIRAELEQELLEAYQTYDSYIERSKADEKKKKKRRWLLDLLGISENIRDRKNGIGMANSSISALQNELNTLKQQRSADNLKKVMRRENMDRRRDFCDCVEKREPRNHCKEYCENINRGYNPPKVERHHKHEHKHEHKEKHVRGDLLNASKSNDINGLTRHENDNNLTQNIKPEVPRQR